MVSRTPISLCHLEWWQMILKQQQQQQQQHDNSVNSVKSLPGDPEVILVFSIKCQKLCDFSKEFMMIYKMCDDTVAYPNITPLPISHWLPYRTWQFYWCFQWDKCATISDHE